jgi:hypothetical protein
LPPSVKEVGFSCGDSEQLASTTSKRRSDVAADEYLQDQVKNSTCWDMDDPEFHRCDCPNCPYRSLDNLKELGEELQTLCESQRMIQIKVSLTSLTQLWPPIHRPFRISNNSPQPPVHPPHHLHVSSTLYAIVSLWNVIRESLRMKMLLPRARYFGTRVLHLSWK